MIKETLDTVNYARSCPVYAVFRTSSFASAKNSLGGMISCSVFKLRLSHYVSHKRVKGAAYHSKKKKRKEGSELRCPHVEDRTPTSLATRPSRMTELL
jgi:hypothetical protein